MRSFLTYYTESNLITEAVSKTEKYENKVLKVMKKLADANSDLKLLTGALSDKSKSETELAGFYSHGNHIEIEFHGIKTGIELKRDAEAQLSGSSINYDMAEKEMYIEGSKNISKTIADHVLAEYSKQSNGLNKLIDFIRNQEPSEYNSKITGFPMRCSKEAWSSAVDSNMTKSLVVKLRSDIDFIIDHYADKGVDYIQLGKTGLFYLKRNPLNLPVPQLTGEINIEIRPAKGSTVFSTKIGEYVTTAILRIQGRLVFNAKSNYSLDSYDSARELFKNKVKTIETDKPVEKTEVKPEEKLEEAAKCTGPTKKTSSDKPDKKWMQCVKDEETGEYKRVHWGQPGVTVSGKRNTARRKSFRARHKCDTNPPKKGTPRYQACKDW